MSVSVDDVAEQVARDEALMELQRRVDSGEPEHWKTPSFLARVARRWCSMDVSELEPVIGQEVVYSGGGQTTPTLS